MRSVCGLSSKSLQAGQVVGEAKAPRQRSRLATFGLAVLAIALLLIGALLVISGSSGLFHVSLFGFGVAPELPGLIVLALGFVVLFRSGRPARIDDD